MRHKKILFVAIAMLFSFNNAHAQFFKKLMKTVQEVGEVVTDITGETSNGTPVNSNTTTTTSSSLNSSQNNTAPATTTKADDGSFSMSLNAPGFEVKLLGGNRNGNVATYEFIIINKTGKTRDANICAKEGCSGFEDYKTFASDDQYETYDYPENMKIQINNKNYYPYTLSANVPSKMRITITNISANAKKIPYLSVAFRGMSDGTSYGQALLQIKNLPLE